MKHVRHELSRTLDKEERTKVIRVMVIRPTPRRPEQCASTEVESTSDTEMWFNDEFVEQWDDADKKKRGSTPIQQSPVQRPSPEEDEEEERATSEAYVEERLAYVQQMAVAFWSDRQDLENGQCANMSDATYGLILMGRKCVSESEYIGRFVSIFEMTVRGVSQDEIIKYISELTEPIMFEIESLGVAYNTGLRVF